MKKLFFAFLGVLASPLAGLAEDASSSVPSSVTGAITDLTTTANNYAGVLTPYVKDVAVAFLAITGIVVVVKILRWGLHKATPNAR